MMLPVNKINGTILLLAGFGRQSTASHLKEAFVQLERVTAADLLSCRGEVPETFTAVQFPARAYAHSSL
jgi:hypothetical protein